MPNSHFLDIESMSREQWEQLYALCGDIMDAPEAFTDACRGKVMGSLFYEPSTRTNFSFQAAMMHLGGSAFGFADPNSSSVAKGETLKDTIKMVTAYSDVVVMRNPMEGAALAASLYADCPIINAGDGGHMHPTQTLADLVTIKRLRGGIDGINIGLCGDLKNGRTVHSLIKALSIFDNINFYLISPRDLRVPPYIIDHMNSRSQRFVEVTGLEAIIPQLDVLYMTRIQRERIEDPLMYDRLKGIYVLKRGKLEHAKKDLLIMHPLPRLDEINIDVDDDPRAVYFDQARFGMYARMALLILTLRSGREKAPPTPVGAKRLCVNDSCITASEPYLPALTKSDNGAVCCAYCDKGISGAGLD